MGNFEISNNDTGKARIFDPIFQEKDAELTFAGAGTVAEGTVLGIVTVSQTFFPFKSDAADGSQIPKAVLTYEQSADGAGDVIIRPMIGGEVDYNYLVFEKVGDDLDTVISGETVREHLRKYGIIARESVRLDESDNQ